MAHDIRDLADEEVMQLVQKGDPRAFELLYDRHGGAAFSLAYRMVGKQAPAEDVVQEAFLSIWRSRLRYDQTRGSVRTWVLGIVHNRGVDALRRSTVHDRRRETLDVVEERYEARERTDVEVARREEARSVRGALETLPVEQRQTIELAYFGGFTHSEIAKLLQRAGRHREGTDAARPGEDETPARGGRGMSDHTRSDHTRYQDDIGAYLLGALNDLERQAFERHLARCGDCQEELERLRPAADALPGSVEQIQPPPRLKASLMEVVEREAEAERPAPSRPRRRFAKRRFLRPALVGAVLLIGLVIGFSVAQLGGDETRTVAATIDKAMPQAGGDLRIDGDEATLRLHDMPELAGARVYQVWLQHGDRMVPARTFEVGRSGTGQVDLRDVGDADGVYVTREARGGAQVPSEDPIVSVPL